MPRNTTKQVHSKPTTSQNGPRELGRIVRVRLDCRLQLGFDLRSTSQPIPQMSVRAAISFASCTCLAILPSVIAPFT